MIHFVSLAENKLPFHVSPQPPCSRRHHLSLVRWATGTLGGTDTEAVAELARDVLQCTHAAGTGGLSPLGLLSPVVLSDGSAGVSAVGASVLLDVEGAAAAATAQNVRLVVAFTERGSTLGHFELSTPVSLGGLGVNSSFGVSPLFPP